MPEPASQDFSASLPVWYSRFMLLWIVCFSVVSVVFLAIEVPSDPTVLGFLAIWVVGLAGFAYLYLFRLVVAVTVESDVFWWRAPLAGGSARLSSVRGMRPLLGMAIERIEVSEGRGIWISVFRGLDEVGKALQDRIPGFTYEFGFQAKLAMLVPFPRWRLRAGSA
jgi:hypothetical protein